MVTIVTCGRAGGKPAASGRLGPAEAGFCVNVVRQAECAFAEDVPLHVAGANDANRTVVLTALCGESAPRWLAEATAAALRRALAKFQDAGLDVVINEPRQGVYAYTQIWETLLALGLVYRTPHFGHASAESYKAKLYTE